MRRGRAWSRKRTRSRIAYRSTSPSGSRTRGWRRSKPIPGVERHRMRSKCGRTCFLMPKEEKFPICAHDTCKRSCKGLLSAKIRAKQWKYPSVARKADNIATRMKCSWKHK